MISQHFQQLYRDTNANGTIAFEPLSERIVGDARPAMLVVGHRRSVQQGVELEVIGVIAGLAASAGLTKLMAALLFGVSTTDLETFVTTAALVTLVALLASYPPARRAAKVDPILALRHD